MAAKGPHNLGSFQLLGRSFPPTFAAHSVPFFHFFALEKRWDPLPSIGTPSATDPKPPAILPYCLSFIP